MSPETLRGINNLNLGHRPRRAMKFVFGVAKEFQKERALMPDDLNRQLFNYILVGQSLCRHVQPDVRNENSLINSGSDSPVPHFKAFSAHGFHLPEPGFDWRIAIPLRNITNQLAMFLSVLVLAVAPLLTRPKVPGAFRSH